MTDPTATPTPTETRQDARERHQIVGVGRGDLPGGVYVKCQCDEHVLIPAAAYTDHVLAAVSAADLDAIRAEHSETYPDPGHSTAVCCAKCDEWTPCTTVRILDALAAALAARPAPVVNAAMADAAIEALGMNAYMTPERVAAHHAALGVVWTDPRTVAAEPTTRTEWGVACDIHDEVSEAEDREDAERIKAHHDAGMDHGHTIVRRTVTDWTPAEENEHG